MSDAEQISSMPKRYDGRFVMGTLLIAVAVVACVMAAWFRQPPPSPFVTEDLTNNDPLETVLEGVLLPVAQNGPVSTSRMMSKLSETLPPVEVFGNRSHGFCDGTKWHSDRRVSIRCSPEAAEEIANYFHIWSEFAARRAGAVVNSGRYDCKGRLVTRFEFSYEYPHRRGSVKVTVTPPKGRDNSPQTERHQIVRVHESEPDVYELSWEINESPKS